jgi:fructose-1,6-bisphosphatase I
MQSAGSAEAIDSIFETVAATTPEIRSSIVGRRGTIAGENPSGETRLAADARADELLCEAVSDLEDVGAVASEEREEPIDCGDGLSVTLDPLDGSSNLASNNLMGTIVGVFDAELPAGGESIVAAAYLVYGPITTMMSATETGVTSYELVDGDRRIAEEDLTLPADPTVYGFGGGDDDWLPGFAAFADEIRHELKLRYGGALVGDVNQVLNYGGIFAYPALQSRSEGKLRLQYEGIPMAYIVERAGGRSSDGERSLLDRTPEELHERVPLHLGTDTLIDRLESALE